MLKPIVFAVNDETEDNNDNTNDDTNNDDDKTDDIIVDNNDNTDNSDNNNQDDVIVEKNIPADVTIKNVFFGFDEHTTNLFYSTLDKLAGYLFNNPEAVVELGGHTDAQGDDIYNDLLSKKRANFVKEYLMKKGAKDNNLVTKGYGESLLIASDLAPFTRKYNRRVEFKVIKAGKSTLNIETIKVPNEYKLK